MAEVVSITNRNTLLDNQINQQAAALAGAEPLRLPDADSALVVSYIEKLEGNYDIARAKSDTDQAIRLLYIAYNTTPQAQGQIRVQISAIMNALIEAQQDSERKIKGAVRVARNIGITLLDTLPDWLDVKKGADAEEIKAFVTQDLLAMARRVIESATRVKDSLTSIVEQYDKILRNIGEVMASSEIALSETLEANRKIKDEIVGAKARRAQLDSLVTELQAQVDRFDKLARNYGAQAASAEDKAFWASITATVTQVLAAAVPLATLAATGGASAVIGGATVGALASHMKNNENPEQLLRKSSLQAQRDAQSTVVSQHQQRVSNLEVQREAASSDTAKAEVDKTLQDERTQLRDAQARLAAYEEQLGAVLREISAAAGQVSTEMKERASSLRQLESQMLENVEKYEGVKREQAAELIKMTVLLDGKRTVEQSIELAVQSLNLSISALKRSKEIVEEIAFFFKSFSDFMQLIIDAGIQQVEAYEKAAESATLRKNSLARLVSSTDEFFVTQAAQWQAVSVVSKRFVQVFSDGWSTLNRLSGNYISGDQLEAYLESASYKLKKIVDAREEASKQRISSLRSYRAELAQKAGEV